MTGATMAAETGTTGYDLMAIYGWEGPRQAALYTRKANCRKLAASGMHFIALPERNSDKSVVPEMEVEEVRPKRGPK